MKKAGFVALIGEPNAGKSTLLNHFVGSKVSIVTHKVQTTRTKIRGIVICLLYTSPSPRDRSLSRMPSSA